MYLITYLTDEHFVSTLQSDARHSFVVHLNREIHLCLPILASNNFFSCGSPSSLLTLEVNCSLLWHISIDYHGQHQQRPLVEHAHDLSGHVHGPSEPLQQPLRHRRQLFRHLFVLLVEPAHALFGQQQQPPVDLFPCLCVDVPALFEHLRLALSGQREIVEDLGSLAQDIPHLVGTLLVEGSLGSRREDRVVVVVPGMGPVDQGILDLVDLGSLGIAVLGRLLVVAVVAVVVVEDTDPVLALQEEVCSQQDQLELQEEVVLVAEEGLGPEQMRTEPRKLE